MADHDEQLILDFLRSRPTSSFSGAEIARKAAGRHRFEEDPRWAVPVLQRLVASREVECNSAGSYCIRDRPSKD